MEYFKDAGQRRSQSAEGRGSRSRVVEPPSSPQSPPAPTNFVYEYFDTLGHGEEDASTSAFQPDLGAAGLSQFMGSSGGDGIAGPSMGLPPQFFSGILGPSDPTPGASGDARWPFGFAQASDQFRHPAQADEDVLSQVSRDSTSTSSKVKAPERAAVPPKRKPRRSNSDVAHERRKAQNRAAQKVYRSKKLRHVKDLEESLHTLEVERKEHDAQMQSLRMENNILKSYLRTTSLASSILQLAGAERSRSEHPPTSHIATGDAIDREIERNRGPYISLSKEGFGHAPSQDAGSSLAHQVEPLPPFHQRGGSAP